MAHVRYGSAVDAEAISRVRHDAWRAAYAGIITAEIIDRATSVPDTDRERALFCLAAVAPDAGCGAHAVRARPPRSLCRRPSPRRSLPPLTPRPRAGDRDDRLREFWSRAGRRWGPPPRTGGSRRKPEGRAAPNCMPGTTPGPVVDRAGRDLMMPGPGRDPGRGVPADHPVGAGAERPGPPVLRAIGFPAGRPVVPGGLARRRHRGLLRPRPRQAVGRAAGFTSRGRAIRPGAGAPRRGWCRCRGPGYTQVPSGSGPNTRASRSSISEVKSFGFVVLPGPPGNSESPVNRCGDPASRPSAS